MDIKCGAFIRSAGLKIVLFSKIKIFSVLIFFPFLPHDWPGRTRREVNCLFIFTDHKMIRRKERREERDYQTFPWLEKQHQNKMDEG